VIQLESVSKGYGGQTLFTGLSWTITGGERIGLVGPNGAGKTTLCRILAGVEEPDEGVVSRARATTVGYLAQEVSVDGEQSVLAEALSGFADVWALEREMEQVAAALSARRVLGRWRKALSPVVRRPPMPRVPVVNTGRVRADEWS
jgi:ATP-binding cassette subfamily F protein 3